MINILSYVGMDTQSEICLWCLLGLVRTIFDATLFKVNANLKQVWQMNMPAELSMPLQRALRTMISGIMLVQCFTVYVYLASYIVLLYPVFLEERPSLVLPWLLLAAVRKLLCELTSLALGLGTCLLLGPAKPPCIKFVVVKLVLIMPAFYMWMLVLSYYHALKVAETFKTFPANLPSTNNDFFDYGLELAVRRRRTKSLLGEAQLRKKLVANLYGEGTPSATDGAFVHPALETSNDTIFKEEGPETGVFKPSTALLSDIGVYAHEDWFGSELVTPRDTDRILEQIVLMLLRIATYLKREALGSIEDSGLSLKNVPALWLRQHSSAMSGEITETPPNVASSKGNIASYLREYPHIFMKKQNTNLSQTELRLQTLNTVHSQVDTDDDATSTHKLRNSTSSEEISSVGVENVPITKQVSILDSIMPHDKTVKIKLPENSKAGTSREIHKEDNNKEVSGYQNFEDESTLNLSYIKEISNGAYNIFNLSKDKDSSQKNANLLELTENIICVDATNKELPLRIQSNDGNIQEIKESKEEDNNKEVSGYQNLKEESILNISFIKEIINDAYDISNLSKDKDSSQKNANMLELTENIIYEDAKNKELTLRIQSNDDKIQETIESKEEDNIKEVSGYQNLKEESILNLSFTKEIINDAYDISNLSKVKDSSQKNANMLELTENIIYEDDKNKELTLRIQSNDDNIQETKESKKEDNIKEVTGYQNLKQESTLNLSYIKEMNNDALNLSKDKDSSQKKANTTELTENIIDEDAKTELPLRIGRGKELPLRIQSNDDKIQESKENSSDKKILFQTKNKGVEPDDKNEVDSLESTEFHSFR